MLPSRLRRADGEELPLPCELGMPSISAYCVTGSRPSPLPSAARSSAASGMRSTPRLLLTQALPASSGTRLRTVSTGRPHSSPTLARCPPRMRNRPRSVAIHNASPTTWKPNTVRGSPPALSNRTGSTVPSARSTLAPSTEPIHRSPPIDASAVTRPWGMPATGGAGRTPRPSITTTPRRVPTHTRWASSTAIARTADPDVVRRIDGHARIAGRQRDARRRRDVVQAPVRMHAAQAVVLEQQPQPAGTVHRHVVDQGARPCLRAFQVLPAAVLVPAEVAARIAEPQPSPGIHVQRADAVVAQARGRATAEGGEVDAVVADHAFPRGEPEVAVRGLGRVAHRVVRQAVARGPCIGRIVAQRWRTRRGGQRQRRLGPQQQAQAMRDAPPGPARRRQPVVLRVLHVFLLPAVPQPPRWRTASNRQMPAATDTLRLSTSPGMGMRTRPSQVSRVSRRRPSASPP